MRQCLGVWRRFDVGPQPRHKQITVCDAMIFTWPALGLGAAAGEAAWLARGPYVGTWPLIAQALQKSDNAQQRRTGRSHGRTRYTLRHIGSQVNCAGTRGRVPFCHTRRVLSHRAQFQNAQCSRTHGGAENTARAGTPRSVIGHGVSRHTSRVPEHMSSGTRAV